MKTKTAYPDSQLRDQLDSWVLIDSAACTQRNLKLQTNMLVGYLYVDHIYGFRLRVAGGVEPTPSGLRLIENIPIAQEDLKYKDFRPFELEPLSAQQMADLSLPDRPASLWCQSYQALNACRQRTSLDPFRLPGHPDVLRVWVRVGSQLQGERLVVRVETSEHPSVYECTIMRPPSLATDYQLGDRVTVVELETAGENNLYCVWLADRPTVPHPL